MVVRNIVLASYSYTAIQKDPNYYTYQYTLFECLSILRWILSQKFFTDPQLRLFRSQARVERIAPLSLAVPATETKKFVSIFYKFSVSITLNQATDQNTSRRISNLLSQLEEFALVYCREVFGTQEEVYFQLIRIMNHEGETLAPAYEKEDAMGH